ncbi:hypothetical protein BD769DRAFT_1426089 [Suillus cothurnatus]|nr:hypothetical protein BD769DRAFT_1426089 [Suillus cothurnatus]
MLCCDALMPTASPFLLGLCSAFSTMATSASFHGIVGLQNTSRYQIARKNYWHYDAFIATPEIGDICVNVFTFGANTASAEDGIYLLDMTYNLFLMVFVPIQLLS